MGDLLDAHAYVCVNVTWVLRLSAAGSCPIRMLGWDLRAVAYYYRTRGPAASAEAIPRAGYCSPTYRRRGRRSPWQVGPRDTVILLPLDLAMVVAPG